jgi:iron complex outermembrane recepter protein
MRLSVAFAVTCLAMAGLTTANEASAAIRRPTAIIGQGLGPALQQLAKERDVQLVYRSEVVGERQTRGASGELTFEEALTKLLEGTGLTYEFLGDKAITIIALPNPNSAQGADGGRPLAEISRLDDGKSPNRPETVRPGSSGEPIDLWSRFRLAQLDQGGTSNDKPAVTSGTRQGEQAPTRLSEILVTAQKRTERIQEVPAPVTTINAEPLAINNQLRLQDYYSKIPGLGLALSGNGSTPVVAIRGVFTGADTNPTTGVVVDEVPFGSSVTTAAGQTFPVPDLDPSELSRIEVLRGPQGTLYGAASMGGLLKYVTVDPSTEGFSGHLQLGGTSLSHSNDYGYSVRGAINVPVSDTLGVRVSGFTVRDPGFIDNAETGEKDANDRDSDGGRLSALWRPSDNLSLKLSALIQDTERVATQDVDTALSRDPEQRFLVGSGFYNGESQAYSATLVANLGEVELTSATGYSVADTSNGLDTTLLGGGLIGELAELFFPGTGRALTSEDNDVDKFTQELRASFPLGQRIDWLWGAFYTDEDITVFSRTEAVDAAATPAGVLFAQVIGPIGFEEVAAFTTMTVQFTDRWDVQFGGRYSENRQTGQVVSSGAFVGPDPILVTLPKTDDSAFTYLVTPRMKISPDLMMYARLASGYRPGGANFACGVPGVPCSFEPDKTQNYDIGIKGTVLEGALTYDFSAYYIDWKNIQINQLLAPDGFNTFTDNVSRADSQGVELSVDWRPWDGTTLTAWVAYNQAELSETFVAAGASGESGDRLPFGSRISGYTAIDQTFRLRESTTAYIGASASYVGDRKGKFQPLGVERETFPSYVQLDLRTGATFDSWSVDLFVNNLTDKRGVLRGGVDANFIPSYFTYIQPRTIGITVGKTF